MNQLTMALLPTATDGNLRQTDHASHRSSTINEKTKMRSNFPQQQIAALHATHWASLASTGAWLVGDRAIGEEIAQEAFVRLIEQWDRLDDPKAAPAWLRRAVVNLSRTQVRRFAIGRKKYDVVSARVPRSDRSFDAFGESLADTEMGPAVRSLPRRQRECVVLRFVHDLTIDEIAESLDIHSGTVKTHMHRALQALEETLTTTNSLEMP